MAAGRPQWSVPHRGGALVERLALLDRLFGEEVAARRPGRDLVLARLVEVLLVEALRTAQGTAAAAGLLRGLADKRIAGALRQIHGRPERSWTVAALAGAADRRGASRGGCR